MGGVCARRFLIGDGKASKRAVGWRFASLGVCATAKVFKPFINDTGQLVRCIRPQSARRRHFAKGLPILPEECSKAMQKSESVRRAVSTAAETINQWFTVKARRNQARTPFTLTRKRERTPDGENRFADTATSPVWESDAQTTHPAQHDKRFCPKAGK